MLKNKKSKYYSLLIIIGAILISVLSFGLYGYSNLSKGSPKIEITPASYDFGNIPYEKVEYAFTVKNTGNAPLKIRGVSTSCGCTKAAIESELVQPGKTTNLQVSYDPNSMGGDANGNVLRMVYVKSNDPKQPEIEVKITAKLN